MFNLVGLFIVTSQAFHFTFNRIFSMIQYQIDGRNVHNNSDTELSKTEFKKKCVCLCSRFVVVHASRTSRSNEKCETEIALTYYGAK